MLTCKSIVIINADNDPKGERAIVVPYNRVYLEFSALDEVEEFGRNNKGKAVQVFENGVDGEKKDWKGTTPKEKHTAHFDSALITEALNYLKDQWGDNPDFKDIPEDDKAHVILLTAASYGSDLWLRAKIQAGERPKAAQDPKVAKEKLAKALVASALANGKVLSMEKALAKAALLMESDDEEEAAA